MGSLSRLVGLSALTVFRDSLTYPRPPVLQALAGSLGALSALSSLNLSGNLLGQAGVFALAPVLPLLARSLRHLCLWMPASELRASRRSRPQWWA